MSSLNTLRRNTGSAPALDAQARECCRRWYEEHGEAVYNYVRFQVAEPDAAEDIVADTFLRALRAAGRSTTLAVPGRGSWRSPVTWCTTTGVGFRCASSCRSAPWATWSRTAPRPRSDCSARRRWAGCSTRSTVWARTTARSSASATAAGSAAAKSRRCSASARQTCGPVSGAHSEAADLITIRHCCVDFDGGGPDDDGLLVVGVAPDRVMMAALYEETPGRARSGWLLR